MDERKIFARGLPPPIDVAVDGHFAGKLTPELRYELQGWALLSLAALALAGILALMLSLARAPGAEILPFLNQIFFRRVLVVHVTFAFVAWYLGVQGAMTVLVTARLEPDGGRTSFGAALIGRIGLYGAVLSYALLLIPAIAGRNVPSPNNYIPLLIDPFYYAGLACLALSVALSWKSTWSLLRSSSVLRPSRSSTCWAKAVARLMSSSLAAGTCLSEPSGAFTVVWPLTG